MSQNLLCAGIETKQPIYWIENDRFVAQFELLEM